MLSENLYQKILIDPLIEREADTLKIVSGYTSPVMCCRHIEDIVDKKRKINIELIIGMPPSDGIFEGYHIAFSNLTATGHLDQSISCSYVCKRPAVHSKLYIWERNGQPIEAYLGSANYSQGAFIARNTREILEICSPSEAIDYFNKIRNDTIICNNPNVEDEITINKVKKKLLRPPVIIDGSTYGNLQMTTGELSAEFVTLSLLDAKGEMPDRSGLNWGQRGREPNQAYISIPAKIMRKRFFPERKQQFTVLTDDGKAIICTTAQTAKKDDPLDYYKAIASSQNNSLLGEYFRERLGLKSGVYVEKSDILNYGRSDVIFYKIDPETYYMDFSLQNN